MTPVSSPALYVRLPNWVGDVCMSLPSLDALLATGSPVMVCARAWAQDLLAAYPLAGFIPMRANWRADRAAVHAARRAAGHRQARALLLPDSLSSALVFRFAGLRCAGYRDDGAPGSRAQYGPTYYGGFLLDPGGNSGNLLPDVVALMESREQAWELDLAKMDISGEPLLWISNRTNPIRPVLGAQLPQYGCHACQQRLPAVHFTTNSSQSWISTSFNSLICGM